MVFEKIQILPENVINKIAAGEIVERPVAVVKELVENSIDAGAKNIRVSFSKGGKYSIVVEDDGAGMTKEEAMLAIKQHATSKLQTIDDLNALETFGFRGEALPSISSVSKFTLITGKHNSLSANEIIIHGGEIVQIKECTAMSGTKIIVNNLFYNVPARRKFLKTDDTEADHIITLIKNLSLAEPDINFTLLRENEMVFSSPEATGYGDRVNTIFKYNDKFIDFEYQSGGLRAKGTICDPKFGNVCKKQIVVFINNRLVKDELISRTLCESLRPIFPNHRGVLAYLFLQLNQELVDVNVHPTKREVRFKNELIVKNFIKNLAANIFYTSKNQTDVGHMNNEKTNSRRELMVPKTELLSNLPNRHLQVEEKKYQQKKPITWANTIKTPVLAIQNSLTESPGSDIGAVDWQCIGLANKEIAIFLCNSGIIFLNIRLGLSRVVYDTVLSEKNAYKHVQKLLLPIEVLLSPIEVQLLEEFLPILSSCGISIYLFGKNAYKIDAIPEWLSYQNTEIMIKHLIADYGNISAKKDLEQAKIIFTKNFPLGIDVNNYQTPPELNELKNTLFASSNPMICPLGNAIFFEMSFTEINRRFTSKN